MADIQCTHYSKQPIPQPKGVEACQTCQRHGSLRVCATCGNVGCCESMAGHARDHAKTENHPVITPLTGAGGGKTWVWCYACGDYVS